MTLLDVNQLSIQASESLLVSNISFSIKAGERLALVGESGSGKSLTAKTLLQLLPHNLDCKGSAKLAGDELMAMNASSIQQVRGKRIGMIFQEPLSALNPLHKVGRQLAESISTHNPLLDKQQLQNRVNELMQHVNLKDTALLKRYPHELSGGQRQRIMIAMAIANDPELLIADEPTTALDVTIAGEILDLISQLCQQKNMGLLLITHDLNIVKKHADRVCVMKRGEIVEQNTCQELFNNPSSDYTRQLLGSHPPRDISQPGDKIVLQCENVSVHYLNQGFWKKKPSEKAAVEEINFTLCQSETLGIVGESGSGKSTLAKAILRLLEYQGQVVINDTDLSTLGKKPLRQFRKHIQVVFQDPFSSLSPRMSVAEIITEGLKEYKKLSRAEAEQAALSIMNDTGLDETLLHRFPHELSGGQRQRVAIARALILQPDVLVLDEPTSALDHAVQLQIIALLQKLQKKYATSYVFISHDIASVQAVSHQLLVLRNGQLVEQGDCKQILQNPQKEYTRTLIEAANL